MATFLNISFIEKILLGLRPMANSIGVLPLEVTCLLLIVATVRINWAQECLMTEWTGIHKCQEEFLEQSYTHLCSVRPWCVWSTWVLFVAHSVECMRVRKPYLHKLPSDSSGMYP